MKKLNNIKTIFFTHIIIKLLENVEINRKEIIEELESKNYDNYIISIYPVSELFIKELLIIIKGNDTFSTSNTITLRGFRELKKFLKRFKLKKHILTDIVLYDLDIIDYTNNFTGFRLLIY